ncbi:MAG: glycosyltransferase [Acidimicrobiia bacterium]
MDHDRSDDACDARVAAVVLTHNAPLSLERCVAALAAQTAPLTALLVTDNASDDPIDAAVDGFDGAVVQRLSENVGPAGGYAHALSEFLESGLEWAWVMDDDCVPDPDALEIQLGLAEPSRMVLPTVQWDETGETVRSNGWWGALIHRSVIERVGVPNPDLFWWTEDTEYLQWRIPEAGVQVVWTDRPVIRVSRGRVDETKPAWKYYYEARNQVYHRLYVQRPTRPVPRPTPRHLKVSVRTWRAARSVARLTGRVALREHDDRVRKFASIARGSFDGVRGRLGATVVPDTAHRPSAPTADARDPERRSR